MDKGPWSVLFNRPCSGPADIAGISSDDFERDVMIRVSGDWPSDEDKLAYHIWLCEALSAASAAHRADGVTQ